MHFVGKSSLKNVTLATYFKEKGLIGVYPHTGASFVRRMVRLAITYWFFAHLFQKSGVGFSSFLDASGPLPQKYKAYSILLLLGC